MNSIGPAQGIQDWLGTLDRAATTVTRTTTPVSDPATASTDSLVDGMVGLNETAAGVHAAIAVIKTQDQMLGSIIDMLA
jgi:hypothetical protein